MISRPSAARDSLLARRRPDSPARSSTGGTGGIPAASPVFLIQGPGTPPSRSRRNGDVTALVTLLRPKGWRPSWPNQDHGAERPECRLQVGGEILIRT